MSQRLFVTTGCLHSDLDLPARVFTALGVPCGHEEIFHTAAFERGGTLFWPQTAAGDASWYAAPVLGKLPESSVVMHQVRDPLSTIQDMMASRFFELDTPSRDFAGDFIPELRTDEGFVPCMRFWLEWNRMIEAAGDYDDLIYSRYRVEDFDGQGAAEQLALIGLQRDIGNARRAVEAVRGDRLRKQVTLTWNDLPDIELTAELKETAERYGYRTSRRTQPRAFSA